VSRAQALLALVPRDFVFAAKAEVGRWPLIGTLVRRVGHETTHVFNRPLDRRRRFPNQKEAARGNEKQGGERDHHECGDEIRVFVFQLNSVGHGHRNELAA